MNIDKSVNSGSLMELKTTIDHGVLRPLAEAGNHFQNLAFVDYFELYRKKNKCLLFLAE